MPVPYGFGVGDFLAVSSLVWKVYKSYADAPEQFRNFSMEILSLHVVIKKVEQQLASTPSGAGLPGSGSSALRLNSKDTEDLKTLYEGLHTIVAELDALHAKYQSLESNPKISFDRLKWGKEDLAGLKESIHTNINLLTAFNASLAKCVVSPPNLRWVNQ